MGVVIVAAGGGHRIGGTPKQFREIAGVPMLLRAVRPFAAHPEVAHVAVVLPPAHAADPPAWLATLAGGSLSVVAGGAHRAVSAASGVAALPAGCTVVLVHDAARPFVGRAVIDAVISEARAGRGGVAAVPVSDTLKECAEDGVTIARTVPRARLWRAQTPQGFPRTLLETAQRLACPGDDIATDDAALVERAGGVVRLVPDSARNFKITSSDDLALAELWATHPT